jgi:hypothetical protein
MPRIVLTLSPDLHPEADKVETNKVKAMTNDKANILLLFLLTRQSDNQFVSSLGK